MASRSARFVVARNPDLDSTLPFLLRIPVDGGPVLLKVRDTWPRTVPVIFAGSRKLAEEWTFRFLGAAQATSWASAVRRWLTPRRWRRRTTPTRS